MVIGFESLGDRYVDVPEVRKIDLEFPFADPDEYCDEWLSGIDLDELPRRSEIEIRDLDDSYDEDANSLNVMIEAYGDDAGLHTFALGALAAMRQLSSTSMGGRFRISNPDSFPTMPPPKSEMAM